MSPLAGRLLLPFLEKYAHPACVHAFGDMIEASSGKAYVAHLVGLP